VTSSDNTLVVTYQASANEVIGGKKFRRGFSPRLSVFVRGPKGWQILGHANFNTPCKYAGCTMAEP
jgi:hypothetical protein